MPNSILLASLRSTPHAHPPSLPRLPSTLPSTAQLHLQYDITCAVWPHPSIVPLITILTPRPADKRRPTRHPVYLHTAAPHSTIHRNTADADAVNLDMQHGVASEGGADVAEVGYRYA